MNGKFNSLKMLNVTHYIEVRKIESGIYHLVMPQKT